MHPQILERRTFGAGDRIFAEGSEGICAYIVQDGQVEIYKVIDGAETVIGTLGKGAIFGEMALLDDSPRMASARAVELVTVIIVNRQTFDDKMKKTDPFVRGLLNILADTVRASHQN